MKKPNFFIIGGAKCGTTSMDHNLQQHPKIFMSRYKDRHHFATDLMPNGSANTSDKNYTRFFKGATNELIIGESSVYHLPSSAAPVNIKKYCPEAKILVMFRNPLEVIPSLHSQLYYNGDQQIHNLTEALYKQYSLRVKDGLSYWKSGVKYIPFYYEMVNFADQLEHYRRYFDSSRIHTVLFDDFKLDTDGVVRGVFEFLELDSSFQPNYAIKNQNKIPRSPALARLLKKMNPLAHFISGKFLPDSWLVNLSKLLFRANTIYVTRDDISDETRARLASDLRLSIDKLAIMLDRDLSHWYG